MLTLDSLVRRLPLLAGSSVTALLCVVSVGCGGGDWPRMVSVPPEQVQQVSAQSETRGLVLPDAQPFNVHDRRSSQNPGQAGTARGESDAKAEGTAYCRVEATNGGTASADFLLGHVVHNDGDEPLKAVAKFSFETNQRLSLDASNAETEKGSTAEYQLEVYVRDSDERTIRQVPVASSASDTGPREAEGKAVMEVDFEMKPRTAYHLLLAGKADAKTVERVSASAAVELRNLRIELTFMPAESAPAPAES